MPPESWTIRRMISATLIVLSVAAAFWAAYRFQYALFILLIAMMLRVLVKPMVEWLRSRHIRNDVATAIAYGCLFVVILGIVALIVPLMVDQVSAIATRVPELYTSLRATLLNSGNGTLQQVASGLPPDLIGALNLLPGLSSDTSTVISQAAPRPDAPASPVFATFSNIVYSIFLIVATFMLAIYWTLDSERIMRSLLLRVPTERRDSLREIVTEMEGKVGSFFRGQLILCVVVGVMSIVAYLVIGLPYALVLGIIAGMLEAVPMVGPILGMVPALIIALASAPELAIWVIASMIVIQQLENNLLAPRIMNHSVGINPIVSILSIAAFTLLFGVAGALLAIPIAAILQIVLDRILFAAAVEPEPPPQMIETDSRITTPAGVPALTVVAVAQPANRSKLSVLRLEAKELAADMRKQVRNVDDGTSDEHEEASQLEELEDVIEAIAIDVDSVLAEIETQQAEQKQLEILAASQTTTAGVLA